MTTAHFVANVTGAREICELDHRGTVVRPEKQTKFCLEICVGCSTSDGEIDVEFLARTEVPLMRLDAIPERENRTNSVGHLIAQQIPRLAQHRHLDIYRGIQVRLDENTPIADIGEIADPEFDAELSDSLAIELRKATSRHRAAGARFNDARNYLINNLNYLMHDATQARLHASFIAECMRKSGTPYMAAWNHEKAARLVSAVHDLVGRKNPSHPNYQQQSNSVQSILHSVNVPKLWNANPP